MRFREIILIIFTCFSVEALAQRQIFIGFELGPTLGYPRYRESQYGNLNTIGGSWGLNVSAKVKNNFFFESGIYKYNFGYESNEQFYNQEVSIGGSIKGWSLPIRLQNKFHLKKNKIFITPSLGLLLINNLGSPIISKRQIIDSTSGSIDTISYTQTYIKLKKTMPLFESGVNIEFLIVKSFILDLSLYYSLGFSSVSQSELTYQINNGVKQVYPKIVTSNGNNLQLFIGLKYPIKDIDRRVERYKHKQLETK
ncbi:MAG: hypothetical protein K2X86_05265 [Cytophagaceae bacterium]|nr:hypothetical protein [Cytophagaceae bacterium]